MMIHSGPASPAERSDPNRPRSARTAELLPAVLEALPVGIGLFELGDDEVRFSCGNREFARVLGLERSPSPGRTVREVFDPAEHGAVLDLFARVRHGRDPQSYFVAQRGTKQTANHIWNIDAYPVFTAGRLTHVMVLAEQTDDKFQARQRQQVEADRLRQKANQLAELEKAKAEFLRLASHELRGPAAMLGGYLSMMEDEALGPIPERLRPVLPLLKGKAAQINMLANEMVEAARLEDRRLQLKRRAVDLREVVRRSVDTAIASLTDKHRLHFDDRAGSPVNIAGDLMRLEIILGNLI